MSCVYKIKQAKATLTSTEKKIADYILENKNEVINYSAQTLGEKTKTSSAAIVRFAKKIGYKGYPVLKMELASELDEHSQILDTIIRSEDSITEMVNKLYSENSQNLKETYKLLSPNNIEIVVQWLLKAEKIYLFGVGGSGIVCEDLQHKLLRINYEVMYNHDFHVHLASVAHITNKDIAIAISYGGKTNEINFAMKHAKEVGAKTVGITMNGKTPLSKIVEMVLPIPMEEKELRMGAISSRFSSLVITDLLYFGLAKKDMNETKSLIVKTRQLIKEYE